MQMAVDVGQGITDQSGGGFCAVLVSFQGKKGEKLTDVLGKQCGRPLFLMKEALIKLKPAFFIICRVLHGNLKYRTAVQILKKILGRAAVEMEP